MRKLLIVPSNDPIVQGYFEQYYKSDTFNLLPGQRLAYVPSSVGLSETTFCATSIALVNAAVFMNFLLEKIALLGDTTETVVCIIPYECSGTAQLAVQSFRKPPFTAEFATFDPALVVSLHDFEDSSPIPLAHPIGYLLIVSPEQTNAILLRSAAIAA